MTQHNLHYMIHFMRDMRVKMERECEVDEHYRGPV